MVCRAVDPTVHGEVGQLVVRTSKLASREQLPIRSTVCALVALCAFLTSSSTRAYGQEAAPSGAILAGQTGPAGANAPAPASPAVMVAPAMPPPANPALDLHSAGPEQPSMFERWWFWTAVGAAVVVTAVIIVVSSRGHAPPATDLGNQEFQP
jgi:hypothetical protein